MVQKEAGAVFIKLCSTASLFSLADLQRAIAPNGLNKTAEYLQCAFAGVFFFFLYYEQCLSILIFITTWLKLARL